MPNLGPNLDSSSRSRELVAASVVPVLKLHVPTAVTAAKSLQAALPAVKLYYAVKCNSHPGLLAALAANGLGFEIASPAELQRVVRQVEPARVLCLHPIKSPTFLRTLAACGVRILAADSIEELNRIAQHAPGSAILVRVAVSNVGSQHPLDGKFGCTPESAVRLLYACRERGLVPLGTTMHVGTQCTAPETWVAAIQACLTVLDGVPEARTLSLGGGFPTEYANGPSRHDDVIAAIRTALPSGLTITAEPGRVIAASAGTLEAHVLGVARREDTLWAYLDAGFYHGLYESHHAVGGFCHPISVVNPRRPITRTTLAGPTCDGLDVIARDIQLPELRPGDCVHFQQCGAYSAEIASSFNGFPAPEVQLVD